MRVIVLGAAVLAAGCSAGESPTRFLERVRGELRSALIVETAEEALAGGQVGAGLEEVVAATVEPHLALPPGDAFTDRRYGPYLRALTRGAVQDIAPTLGGARVHFETLEDGAGPDEALVRVRVRAAASARLGSEFELWLVRGDGGDWKIDATRLPPLR